MKEEIQQAILGFGTMALVVVVLISFFGAKTTPASPVIFDSSPPRTSDSFTTPNGWTSPVHHSIPTKMSLQGKVTDLNGGLITDADLEVKISDANSCVSQVFYDYNFSHAVQNGFFNLLLGQNEILPLNFNQDYFICLYVNTQLLSGPQVFRGGQGEVHSEQLFDGNASTPLDINYLTVRNDLNVGGALRMGCGTISWNDSNQTLSIQVSC